MLGKCALADSVKTIRRRKQRDFGAALLMAALAGGFGLVAWDAGLVAGGQGLNSARMAALVETAHEQVAGRTQDLVATVRAAVASPEFQGTLHRVADAGHALAQRVAATPWPWRGVVIEGAVSPAVRTALPGRTSPGGTDGTETADTTDADGLPLPQPQGDAFAEAMGAESGQGVPDRGGGRDAQNQDVSGPDERGPEPAAGPSGGLALLGSNHPSLRAARLAPEDARLYRWIFRAQAEGRWNAVDQAVERLRDRRLLGHVLLQRYLQPGYRATWDDLRLWLRRYGDHPGADRIYALALARQPKGAPSPSEPVDVERASPWLEDRIQEADRGRERSVAPRTRMGSLPRPDGPLSDRIEELVKAGKLATALRVLGDHVLARRMDNGDYDLLRTRIATALFYDGSPRASLPLAAASAERSGDDIPQAHWVAGLAAWRLGYVDRAARHFAAMAAHEDLSPADAAAAAFWAGRAQERLGRAARAERYYLQAARYDRSFYGMIAGRVVGRQSAFRWQVPALTVRHLVSIAESPGGERALALLALDQRDAAEQELRRLRCRDNPALGEAMIALADAAGLPALALQLGNQVSHPEGGTWDAALYPLPHWMPADGYAVDRALLFAVMRQESRFEARLVSRAGAAGVMQIMPETATDMSSSAGAERSRLFDPAWNLSLGQRYIAALLSQPQVGGSLVHLAAAYNAGPSHLQRWRRDLETVSDPLLFIESLPALETRTYVRRVLTNYWIYQRRLGQEPATLAALAAGEWPFYLPGEAEKTQVAIRDQD